MSGSPRIAILHADRPLGAVTVATVDALRGRGAAVGVWCSGAVDVTDLPLHHELFVLKHGSRGGGCPRAGAAGPEVQRGVEGRTR